MKKNIYNLKDSQIIIPNNSDIKKIYLELTSLCNYDCKMCFKNTFDEPLGTMSDKTIEKLKNEVESLPKLNEILLGGLGEPMLHPRIKEISKFIKSKNIKLSINTNGAFFGNFIDYLLEIGVDKFIFSCEMGSLGHKNESILVDNIINLRKKSSNKKVYVTLQMVLTSENIVTLPSFVKRMIATKIDELRLSNLLPMDKSYENSILYLKEEPKEINEIRQILPAGIKLVIPNFELKTERYCNFINSSSVVIKWNGDIAPCYRLLHTGREIVIGKAKEIVAKSFGNILKKNLLDVWNKRDYTWFRYKVKNALFPSCTDCKLKEKCSCTEISEIDCWANEPSCADCLWYREIISCP